MTEKVYTTIGLRPRTKERLAKHGQKGDSYEDIVKKLMDQIESGEASE